MPDPANPPRVFLIREEHLQRLFQLIEDAQHPGVPFKTIAQTLMAVQQSVKPYEAPANPAPGPRAMKPVVDAPEDSIDETDAGTEG